MSGGGAEDRWTQYRQRLVGGLPIPDRLATPQWPPVQKAPLPMIGEKLPLFPCSAPPPGAFPPLPRGVAQAGTAVIRRRELRARPTVARQGHVAATSWRGREEAVVAPPGSPHAISSPTRSSVERRQWVLSSLRGGRRGCRRSHRRRRSRIADAGAGARAGRRCEMTTCGGQWEREGAHGGQPSSRAEQSPLAVESKRVYTVAGIVWTGGHRLQEQAVACTF